VWLIFVSFLYKYYLSVLAVLSTAVMQYSTHYCTQSTGVLQYCMWSLVHITDCEVLCKLLAQNTFSYCDELCAYTLLVCTVVVHSNYLWLQASEFVARQFFLTVFFLLQVPFHLVLRLWDIFMLEGERLLVAMSFNIMKLHRR